MARKIQGLKWARACERPRSIPIGRARGAKLAGLRYERGLARSLPNATHGQWWEFEDLNGWGCCQTDLLLSGCPVVLEAKYTWTWEGHQQLEQLYLPVVGQALGRKMTGLVVCRTLVPQIALAGVQICSNLPDAIASAANGRRVVWHCLGPQPGRSGARPVDRSALAELL